jgi:pyruvate kinase
MAIRLTRTIAIFGPAIENKASIKSLVAKGVNVFRLNLSHGNHALKFLLRSKGFSEKERGIISL